MKNLKLFALMFVMTIVIASCSNTKENTNNTQQETVALNDNAVEEAQEAVEEAVIEAEEMNAEEQETEEEQGEVKPQSTKKSTKKSTKAETTKKAASTTEIEKPAPETSSSTTKIEISNKPETESTKETVSTTASKTTSKPAEKTSTSDGLSHNDFNSLLNKYVSASGTVNYAGFKSDEAKLDNYLDNLAENAVESSWSRNEKMAYWINLYNASTIKLILDNYPTSSIQNINGGKPWDKRWIKSGAKTYTLNEIENSILRPQFKDARIHFAVNCAAQSCPRLMNKAFTSSNLNSLLDENARWFINNSTFNDISAKKVEISKIFDWYSVDFGNIIDYLNKYATTEIKSNAKVSYKEYDWKLNGK